MKLIITYNLITPSFVMNLDYFLIFLISVRSYFRYFYPFSALPSVVVRFCQPIDSGKTNYQDKNQDICTHSPQSSRWPKVYILIFSSYNTLPDDTMINIILASLSIGRNLSKSHHEIDNHLKSDQSVFFHKFRLFFNIFNKFHILFQVFLSIFSTSVSFREILPAH